MLASPDAYDYVSDSDIACASTLHTPPPSLSGSTLSPSTYSPYNTRDSTEHEEGRNALVLESQTLTNARTCSTRSQNAIHEVIKDDEREFDMNMGITECVGWCIFSLVLVLVIWLIITVVWSLFAVS